MFPSRCRGISPHLGTLKALPLPFLRIFVKAVGLQLFVVTGARLGRVKLEHGNLPLLGGEGLNGGWRHGFGDLCVEEQSLGGGHRLLFPKIGILPAMF